MSERIGVFKYGCKYPKCKTRYYNPIYKEGFPNKRFFRFPRNGVVSRQWKEICNMDHSVMTDNFYVCEDHFTSSDFMNYTKQRLKPGVVPIKSGQEIEISDHDYTENSCKDLIDTNANATLSSVQTDANPHIYAFLCEDTNFIPPNPNQSAEMKKLTMYNIHRDVTSILLKLKSTLLLPKTRYLLPKFIRLYRDGQFDYIIKQLEHVSNEFLDSNLEYATPVAVEKWTQIDYKLALSLFVRNGKLYKHLCALFYLPQMKVLKRMLSSIPFKAGINLQIVNPMKLEITKLSPGNCTCVLMMTETMLTCGVQYEETCQSLHGFEDLGHLGRSPKSADRAMVFMLRGLRQNWMQVISYYYSCGPFRATNLKIIILETIKDCQRSGLNVVAFVCEHKATNVNVLSLLCGKSEHQPYFIVNCKKVCLIFEPTSLLKETRNALTKGNVVFNETENKIAELKHIESTYYFDQSNRIFKQLGKLKDHYFDASDLNEKDSIEAARAILSHTVATAIESLVLSGNLPKEAMNTAEFVETIDILYDSLRGCKGVPPHNKKYRGLLTANSPHTKFWSRLLAQMNHWKLIPFNSEDIIRQYNVIHGWRTTMESVFYLWSHLKHEGLISYLSLHQFSMEPLKDILQKVSQYGPNNKPPESLQFVAALKCEILNGSKFPLSSGDLYNLISLETFIENNTNETSENLVEETYFDNFDNNAIKSFTLHEQVAYISGYLLQKIDIPDCKSCRQYLLADWVIDNSEIVSLKKCGNESIYPLYASDTVIRIVDKILVLLSHFLKDHAEKPNLENIFKTIHKRELESFRFCYFHDCNENFITLCIRLGIYRFICDFNDTIIEDER